MTFLMKSCVPSCRRLFRSRAVRGLVKAMSGLPEPKQAGKTRHPTWRCLLIVLLSLVHGKNWVSDARGFAERHEGKLRKLFGEGYSTPSYCTLVRALHKSGRLCAGLVAAMGFASGGGEGSQMDGKAVRATRDALRDNSALDIVELRGGSGMLDFEACGPGSKEKSEKAAMTALIKRNAKALRRGAPLTIDAIAACSTLTSLMGRLGIPFIVCIKNEGKGLGDAIASDFAARKGELKPLTARKKSGGRAETREFYYIEDPSAAWAIYGGRRWKGVAHIGMVRRTSTELKGGKTAEQVRYYLLSEAVTHRSFKEARLGHWSIEAAHWVLDYSFQEDRHRLGGKDHGAALAMGIIRRKAYEAIRSSLRPGMDFSKARRELSEEGFREALYILSGKGATAAAKLARNDQKK